MNPFDADLASLRGELQKNSISLGEAKAELKFFENFNEHDFREKISSLCDEYKSNKYLLENEPLLPGVHIGLDVGIFGKILNLFGESEASRLKRLKEEDLHRKNMINQEMINLDLRIKEALAVVERYKNIDEYKLRAIVKTYECRDEIILEKIQSVQVQHDKIEATIGPLLRSADEYRKQVADCMAGIEDCNIFTKRLSLNINNSRARREVHEACAERFNGNGNPSDVAKGLNNKLEANRRQLIKIEERVNIEVKKMLLVIKRAFIDGNNLCFRRSQYKDIFIGTKAVEAIATHLLNRGLDVTVVFDNHIGRGANHLSFDRVQQNFEKGVKLLQAPPDTSADSVLMIISRDQYDCVISNDKFSDYAERSVVKEGRVFRVIITDSIVAVPMLNLEECILN